MIVIAWQYGQQLIHIKLKTKISREEQEGVSKNKGNSFSYKFSNKFCNFTALEISGYLTLKLRVLLLNVNSCSALD